MTINTDYPCNAANYRKGRRSGIKYIVVHYVGAGGSARDNASYYASSKVGASAHYFVGHASEGGAVYQSVRDCDCAWHCGSETGKYYSECRNDSAIGIEMCCHKNADGEWYFDEITVEKTAELVRELMEKYELDTEHVIRHYDVTHKKCPMPFVDEAKWADFKVRLGMGEEENMAKTVYTLDNVQVQVIDAWDFKLKLADAKKKDINEPNYANAGFFAVADGGKTIPVGNLVLDGSIITDAKNQADWLNTARRAQTTLVVHSDNTLEVVKTDDMMTVPAAKYAISGIPVIRNGRRVSLDEIKSEGYFGNELYDTWHGFLGVRDGRLVYVAAHLGFELMVYLMEVLGIRDAIKLDGGGSFILHNGAFEVATAENRRINSILTWEG